MTLYLNINNIIPSNRNTIPAITYGTEFDVSPENLTFIPVYPLTELISFVLQWNVSPRLSKIERAAGISTQEPYPTMDSLIFCMDDPTLVSVQHVADRLDVNIRTVWRLIAGDKNFPRPVKIGRSTRFVSTEVNAYIESLLAKRRTE